MSYKGLKINNLYTDMNNSLKLLLDNNLICYYNVIKISSSDLYEELFWQNHISERKNCERHFNSLEQYFFFLENSSYNCILFDGSIIRCSYRFSTKNKSLESHNLTWWPSPISKDITEIFQSGYNLSDYIKEHLENNPYKNINMRTPIRFDYDIKNVSDNHPKSHMHMQNSECRIFVDRPLCFNKFIKFIFKNFYYKKYIQYNFWENLDELKIGDISIPQIDNKEFLAFTTYKNSNTY